MASNYLKVDVTYRKDWLLCFGWLSGEAKS